MRDERTDGLPCPACSGDGRVGIYPRGAGPFGLDCPYCYTYRMEGYPIGQVPEEATTLHGEHTGARWFHLWDKQTRVPTDERRGFRVVEVRHIPRGAINRPRIRTEPMPEPQTGRVKHWRTGEFFQHGLTRFFATGPYTRKRQHDHSKAFVEAYGTLKAQRRRRQEIGFAITLLSFILLAAILTVMVSVFIGVFLFHLAIIRTQ